MVYAGAHEDIMIFRARTRGCELLKTSGVWAGVSNDIAPGTTTDQECQLEPGDIVLLHTDGVTEATNATREMFGIDRLCRALERVADRDVDTIRDRLMDQVRGFMSAQADDLTLVVLRYL